MTLTSQGKIFPKTTLPWYGNRGVSQSKTREVSSNTQYCRNGIFPECRKQPGPHDKSSTEDSDAFS